MQSRRREGCGEGLFMHVYLGQIVVPLWARFSFDPFEELFLIYYNYGFFLCGSSGSPRLRRNGFLGQLGSLQKQQNEHWEPFIHGIN